MVTKKAFTLIELIITITIVAILTMLSYAPYNYYQNKSKLKITTREISQLLYESRNIAVNWAIWSSKNISVWVYIDTSLSSNNEIKVFSYPYDILEWNITNTELWDVKLLNKLILREGIQIDDIDWNNNFLFMFNAIDWKLKYYKWNWLTKTLLPDDDKISISFSYKWSTSLALKRTINYFTNTNIIDY